MIHMTLDCVRPTQFIVIQTIHCNVCRKCFFPILPKCLFVIIVIYAYFIDITQDNVEMHLWCDGICNNHVIANCLLSVPVKEFWKSINNWQRYRQKQSATFFGPPCTGLPVVNHRLLTKERLKKQINVKNQNQHTIFYLSIFSSKKSK